MSNGSVWPIDRTLSGTTTQGQSWSKSDDNEVVLHIPQSSSITGASPSDCLLLYPRHSLVVVVGVLPLSRDAVGIFYWAVNSYGLQKSYGTKNESSQ